MLKQNGEITINFKHSLTEQKKLHAKIKSDAFISLLTANQKNPVYLYVQQILQVTQLYMISSFMRH